MLQVSPQHDQRQESLHTKRVEGVETEAVQVDSDDTEQPDLEPRRRFATDLAPVSSYMAPLDPPGTESDRVMPRPEGTRCFQH